MLILYTTEEYHWWWVGDTGAPAKCGASQHHDSLLARKFSASEIIPEQNMKPRKLT